MVLVGVYIAIGSGFTEVRSYFEMTDMQFFNAWPLKVMMVLLVLNLAIVTYTHIPFTLPRYGAWLVHAGIIVLIFGMAFYYTTKKEGLVMIDKGQSVSHFYDGEERALFIRPSLIGEAPMPASMTPLENLPRFGLYLAEDPSGHKALNQPGLQNISPSIWLRADENAAPEQTSLSNALHLDKPLAVNIVGYYPYGKIETQWQPGDAGAGTTGINLALASDRLQSTARITLVSADPASARRPIGATEFEHRQVSDAQSLKLLEVTASQMHRLAIKVGDYDQTLYVTPGSEYPLGDTGYTIKVENFTPAFPAMNGQVVSLITMQVTTPTQQFRRQVIMGRGEPTDWKLGEADSGSLGKRQTKPLDDALKIQYTYNDAFGFAPQQGQLKHTFITYGEQGSDIVVAMDRPVEVNGLQEGRWAFQLTLDGHPVQAIATIAQNLQRIDQIREIPPQQRTRDAGQAGTMQIVLAQVKVGDWSKTVAVPFLPYLLEHPDQWNGPVVELPGGQAAVQLQLGRTVWQLPARVTLEDFRLEHYPGGAVMGGMPRDFISTLRIEDRATGEVMVDEARMNHPVYWPAGLNGKTWTFFQAQWDPQGQRWSVLGVGTRHGTWTMLLGCIMMAAGVLWAFYLRPIIQNRMKTRALAKFGKTVVGKQAILQAATDTAVKDPVPQPVVSAKQ